MKRNKLVGGYLIEFLMMFLAITLGFFAENMREKISEKSKAKELALALIDDLARDTVALDNAIRLYENKEMFVDSLFELVAQPFSEIDQRTYYRLISELLRHYLAYSPSGGSASQLKDTGLIDLLQDDKLRSLLTQYDSVFSDYKITFDKEQTIYIDLFHSLNHVTNGDLLYKALLRKEPHRYGTRELQSVRGIDPIAKDHLNSFKVTLVGTHASSSAYIIQFVHLKHIAKLTIRHLHAQYKN